MRTRPTAALTAGLTAALLLAGCSSPTPDRPAPELPEDATELEVFASGVCTAVRDAFAPAFDAWSELEEQIVSGDLDPDDYADADAEVATGLLTTFETSIADVDPPADYEQVPAQLTRGLELFVLASDYDLPIDPATDDERDDAGELRDLWLELPDAEIAMALNNDPTCVELLELFGGQPLFDHVGNLDDPEADVPLDESLEGEALVVAFAEEVYYRSAFGGEGGPRDTDLLADTSASFPTVEVTYDPDEVGDSGLVELVTDDDPWCLWLPVGVAVAWPEFTPGSCDDEQVVAALDAAVAEQRQLVEEAGGEVDPGLGFGNLEPEDGELPDGLDIDVFIDDQPAG